MCSNLFSIVEGLQGTSPCLPLSAASLQTRFYRWTAKTSKSLISYEADRCHLTEEVCSCVIFMDTHSSKFLTFSQDLCIKNITINFLQIVYNESTKEQKLSKCVLLTVNINLSLTMWLKFFMSLYVGHKWEFFSTMYYVLIQRFKITL